MFLLYYILSDRMRGIKKGSDWQFLILGWMFLRWVIGGSEDSWMCEKGEWVKHGLAMDLEGLGLQMGP